MQTFNQSLALLLTRRLITNEEAFGRSSDPEELKTIIASGVISGQRPAGGAAVGGR
jgi:twitching motility protein PilT